MARHPLWGACCLGGQSYGGIRLQRWLAAATCCQSSHRHVPPPTPSLSQDVLCLGGRDSRGGSYQSSSSCKQSSSGGSNSLVRDRGQPGVSGAGTAGVLGTSAAPGGCLVWQVGASCGLTRPLRTWGALPPLCQPCCPQATLAVSPQSCCCRGAACWVPFLVGCWGHRRSLAWPGKGQHSPGGFLQCLPAGLLSLSKACFLL